MSGLVAAPLLRNDYATALRNAKTYVEIFGDRFYIEVMRHGMKEQDTINEGLVEVARELQLPIVATNDSHYLEQKDAPAHDVLLCIGTGKTVSDTNRMRFYCDQFYLKSDRGDARAVERPPRGLREHRADRRARRHTHSREDLPLPQYPVPQAPAQPEKSDAEYLREICEAGLLERYGTERVAGDPALRARLEYELDVITTMGFSSYFLIVWDFVKYARDRGIPVGPGRGSAVGSLVAYCLRITDLDPLRFDLFFERFLNPERISMPDIDTDFCVERRDEVIEYVTEKYGKDRVAQIVTFGTMAARAAIRDAGRALGVPLPDVDRIAKLIPSGPGGMPIARAIEQIAELKALYMTRPEMRKLLDTAKEIEGLARNAGTHAAGVVISAGPLTDYTPLVRFGDGGINTQYDMDWIERIGLLKMDFLGLRNLTVMENAVDEIRRTVDADFDSRHRFARRCKDVRDARTRRNDGRLPARVGGHEARLRRAAAVALRRHHRARRALPPRTDGLDPAVHREQARPLEAEVLASQTRADLGGDVRHAGLSGAGDADGSRHRGLFDERGRRAAQGDRQEAEGEDPVLSGEVRCRCRGDVRDRSAAGGTAVPFHRAVCRLRLQQVARGRVRADRLSDRVSQSEPPAAVLRCAHDVGQRQDR